MSRELIGRESDYTNEYALKDKDVIKSIPSPDVVIYHRTTSRIGNLTLTFMEDGMINLKRGKDTFTTTAEEMYKICALAQSLRNHKQEIGTTKLNDLQVTCKLRREQLVDSLEENETNFKTQREHLSNEFGV